MEDEAHAGKIFIVGAALPAVANSTYVAVGHWSCDDIPLELVAAIVY